MLIIYLKYFVEDERIGGLLGTTLLLFIVQEEIIVYEPSVLNEHLESKPKVVCISEIKSLNTTIFYLYWQNHM